ncbi:hypothetical protein CR62_24135 [Serratia grimesii]|uniref:Uncharacterized protein n=1 Tax=Serratia grimesii TaxID=82995 RepID=A0ABR4UA64_9GAMM|nr:hypothetical protein CR62_24135 [Serratia grimesii]
MKERPVMPAKENLQTWFGLSRASFCVLPRVLMEAMPEEWQQKMADLLHEYSDSFDTSLNGAVHSVIISAKDRDGKFIKLPEEILDYRHSDREFIDSVRTKRVGGSDASK